MKKGASDMEAAAPADVSIVIPCFEQKRFLAQAIASAEAQRTPAREIIVVDDGSTEDLSDVTSTFPAVQLIRQANRGLAGARNSGLKAAKGEKIIFLDADDRLLSCAVEAGLDCFAKNPEAAFVYGAFRSVRGNSRERVFSAVSTHRDLIRCNWIGMIATVMFDREKVLEVGGFDESLGMVEDWDLYLRLSRQFPFASHRKTVADYVKHGGNASDDVAELMKWIEVVRAKEWDRGLGAEDRLAWQEGEEIWRSTFESNAIPSSLAARMGRRAAQMLRLGVRR
jgi:glycosyltransferase involved in cell wall biosynthesis